PANRATSPILKNGLSGISATGRLRVERVLEDLAGLEREHAAGADGDLLARLRIASDARVLVAHHEVAEAGDLDLLAPLQRLLDGVEHRLDDLGRLLLRKSAYLFVDVFDDVGLGHRASFLHASPSPVRLVSDTR